eukprot:SM000262S09865  [mRNA]  locus=s262:30735:31907:+ [translate_table: standard]
MAAAATAAALGPAGPSLPITLPRRRPARLAAAAACGSHVSSGGCTVLGLPRTATCLLRGGTREAGRLVAPALQPKTSRSLVTAQAQLATSATADLDEEDIYFDGGPHYGDLVVNLLFGLTGIWLPFTIASIFRSLFLRYRFTNKRVTIQSGFGEDDQRDFSYASIVDVKYVPRFIGEWGDLAITLSDKTIVELKCLPKFRDVAKYCLDRAKEGGGTVEAAALGKGFV